MAGFQLTLYGRIWVTPEDTTNESKPADNASPNAMDKTAGF
jgi:hypothetical protein